MRTGLLAILLFFANSAVTALAQGATVPSKCMAIAQTLPGATFANFRSVQAQAGEEVTITYAGHSTYLIDTPAGVRIATDFSGVYGGDPPPRVATMNKAHRTHFTDSPDPAIDHVLRGWNPEGGAAHHALVVDDVYIRNVPTDIRNWDGGLERDGNSIFIFEVADLCIGHVGHLHTGLSDQQYGAIGRLDVLMVPIDGGMTQSLTGISEIADRLHSSILLPMHRHATPLGEFLRLMERDFVVERRGERSLKISLRNLPSRPTIVVLDGV